MMRSWLWPHAARALAVLAFGIGLGLFPAPGAGAADAVAVPPLTARVTDLTGTLTRAQIDSLDATLAELEKRKGSQIAVLMLASTRPETIEQYSIRAAEAWKIGRSSVDDGLILVIAKNDRTLRIEVGRGLEGVIPDVIAKRVIREVVTPRFRSADFHGGIADGIAALIKLVDGEPLPPPQPRAAGSRSHDTQSLFAPLLVATLVLSAFLSKLFGRMGGAGITGAVAGIAVWILTSALFAAVLAALFAFGFALMPVSGGLRHGGLHRGGWSGGASSGGGFSGGGGGFGGGGASGRW